MLKVDLDLLKIKFKKIKDEKILYDVEAIFLVFLPILITLDKYIGIVGTILTGIPFIIGILSVCLYQRKKIIKYIIIAVLLCINAFLIKDYKEQFEFVKLLVIFITTFDMAQDIDFLKKIKRYLKEYEKFITYSILVILGINLIFVLINIQSTGYSKSWNINAFEGLYDDPHQAAYRFCSIIIYMMFYIKENKNLKDLIPLVLCEILLLRTGARTPTALGIALGAIAIYFIKDEIILKAKEIFNKNKRVAITVVTIAMIVLLLYIPQTAFVQKIIVSFDKSFDNGRASLRDAEYSYLMTRSVPNILFGNDIDEIYNVNFKAIYNKIWCHNDLMQILLQFGIIMLIIYFETVIESMIFMMKKQKKFDKMIIVLLNLTFLFVAFYNGLFFHPRFIVTIPIIFAIYKLDKLDDLENNNQENL